MKRLIYFILGIGIPLSGFSQNSPQQLITGTVISGTDGTPLPGAVLKLIGTTRGVNTDENGLFTLPVEGSNITLSVSFLGYLPLDTNLQVPLERPLIISLKQDASMLDEVVVSTGYQALPRERATGSFVQVDNEMLNRRVSTNILDRLDGVVGGLIFNKNIDDRENESALSIRGRSTIYANPEPLIVVDNFPISGDISSINPNDVESITILKDAAAASIWGAFSGNGVIVIKTKKGNYNEPVRVGFNSNLTIGEKPDLYYLPRLSSANYIDFEKYLFDQGYFERMENSSSRSALSPAVEILIKRRDGLISNTEAEQLLNGLKAIDTREDLENYFYQPSVNQQYAVNLSGGGANQQFYFSAAYDRNAGSLVNNSNNRITVNASNTYRLLNRKLELATGLYFSRRAVYSNGSDNLNSPIPYLRLADQAGNALPVAYKYRSSYIDTAGSGKLLDWRYRPLGEIYLSDDRTLNTEYRLNASINYRFIPGLDVKVSYLFTKGNNETEDYYSQESFYARDMINQFSQIDPSTGVVSRPVPLGGILDQSTHLLEAHNLRSQVNFSRKFGGRFSLSSIAGAEIKAQKILNSRARTFGYSRELTVGTPVDYFSEFPLYHTGRMRKIDDPYANSNYNTFNRFVSLFANASLSYRDKYVLSGSARRDASNLFGVKYNQKSVPLWSLGASWELSGEPFYHLEWLPYLRLRITNGYSGNIDPSLSALTTTRVYSGNLYNDIYQSINNPPNPSLRWEKTRMLNAAVDFSFGKDHRVEGSIEFYAKRSSDLIGTAPIDPTTGVASFRGNVADMKGKGVDLSIRSVNIRRGITWRTTLNASYASNEITSYHLDALRMSSLFGGQINPVVGNPLYGVYSFRWAGLDPETGSPRGYLDGEIGMNYRDFYNNSDLSNVVFHGSAVPIYFGNLMNTFSLRGFSLSFNLTYKFKYFYKRPALSYNSLLDNPGVFNEEFNQRWQDPGDERNTTIPSLVYPFVNLRGFLYNHSEIHVARGDHIRLQDIQLEYDLSSLVPSRTFSSVLVYAYCKNLGIIWHKDKSTIDPDYINTPYNPRTFSLGLQINF